MSWKNFSIHSVSENLSSSLPTIPDNDFIPKPIINSPEKLLMCAVLDRACADIDFYARAPDFQKTILSYQTAFNAWCYVHAIGYKNNEKNYLYSLERIIEALYDESCEKGLVQRIRQKYRVRPQPPTEIKTKDPSGPKKQVRKGRLHSVYNKATS